MSGPACGWMGRRWRSSRVRRNELGREQRLICCGAQWLSGRVRSSQGVAMTVARITEISSTSKKSFADAVDNGVRRAAKTLKNVTGAWVADQEVVVNKGKISEYKVRLKVT